jgi:hypothetical protein
MVPKEQVVLDKTYSAAKVTYSPLFSVRALLVGVLPLKMSDVIGVTLAVAALAVGGYDMAHASLASDFNSSEFFRGLAIATLGCGHGFAVAKLGRISNT